MTLLSRLKLRTKLILLLSLSALALVASIGAAASLLHDKMLLDRIDKLRAITEQAVSIAAEFDRRVQAGGISHDEALQQFRNTIRPIRYGAGSGYYFSYGMDGLTIILPPTPAIEGTSRFEVKDADGKLWVQAMIDVARQGGGTVVYRYPKPGSTVAQPKLAYVLPVPGWNLFVATGLYIDDLETEFRAALLRLTMIGGATLLVTMLVAWMISRDITVSLGRLTAAMARLAKGDLMAVIPGTDRHDEVGSMAGAVLVFKDGMAEAERLRAAQDDAKRRAAAEQKTALNRMADGFEGQIGHLVGMLSSSSTALSTTAQAMTHTAAQSNQQAAAVASAAEEASVGLQSVSSAADQLTASIGEISRQVAQSSEITGQAVGDAKRTDGIVRALAERAEKIGTVVGLITNIASQTNLLALNATIEAARAGDTGKGFAVVAAEVKNLANQTAKATHEIDAQISEIQAATREAVEAIRGISATIEDVSAIATTIASAVEEQGAATSEIARNVQQAAQAAQEVTVSISGVSQTASETGSAAGQVLTAARGLSEQAEQLSGEVRTFVAGVRAA